MEDEALRWIWLVAGVALLVGEIATAGFYLLPFAVGAFAAALLAFLGIGLAGQLVVCLAVSGATFLALRPLAARLDRTGKTEGIGSRRLVGEPGTVLATIPDGDVGLIRVGREEWRAEAVDGQAIAQGTKVRVVDLRGTRAVVQAFEAPPPAQLPD